MLSAIKCTIKEINMKNIDLFYKHDLFIYTMNIILFNDHILNIESIRLVELNIISCNHIIFRFINMNEYGKRNYKKFTESYTEFNLYPAKNILSISYYTYWMNGQKNSKDIIDIIELDILKCPIINNFLYFLYNKHNNSLKLCNAKL